MTGKFKTGGVVRLADIAKECGVGASTVSRVLNGISDGFSVRTEVRKRILGTAAQMNYVPNVSARNLRTRRTENILIFGFRFFWSSLHSMYGQILEHSTNLLTEKGYTVHAIFADSEKLVLASMVADGAILLTANDKVLMQKLDDVGVPFVILNDCAGKDRSWIDIDDVQGTALAMKHLIASGHRRIAYCGPQGVEVETPHKSISIRQSEYRRCMAEVGLEPQEIPVTAVEVIRKKKITAALVYCNNQAEILRAVCSAVNIRVPADLEIVTFNRPTLSSDELSLSTVSPDLDEVGNATGKMLLNLIETKKPAQCIFQQKLLLTTK